MKVTGGADGKPITPLAGKFDMKHCIALALHGHDASAADFREPWVLDPEIAATGVRIAVAESPEMGFASARLRVETDRGPLLSEIAVAKGHPGNPMGWEDMLSKFDGLCAPTLGNRVREAFDLVRRFGDGAAMSDLRAVLVGLDRV
mgnify:FL=1